MIFVRYIYFNLKKIILIGLLVLFGFIFFENDAKAANFDFSSYNPTLTSLYPSLTDINSSYTSSYVLGSPSDYDFIYHHLNDDRTMTSLYYKFDVDSNADSVGDPHARITSGALGQTVEGYFSGYSRAISSTRKMGNIVADFVNNYVKGNNSNAAGAAIMVSSENSGTGFITGDFINNSLDAKGISGSVAAYAAGGAIYMNRAKIDGIKGNFIGNSAVTEQGKGYGGAIQTTNPGVEITTLDGQFIGNYVSSGKDTVIGGAINMGGILNSMKGTFVANHAETKGITVLEGSKLRTVEASGGAMYISSSATIGRIDADFYSNYVKGGATAYGGAIYYTSNVSTPTKILGSFIGNYAESTNNDAYYALGGAVFTNKTLDFVADGKDISFTNNYTLDRRGKNYNAIFVSTTTASQNINFKVANDGSIVLNDGIIGGNIDLWYGNKYNINIEGDGSGSVAFNAEVVNADKVSVKNTTLKLGSYDHKDTNALNNKGNGLFLAGSGSNPVTSLSLDKSDLVMNYDQYQELKLVDFSANNNSYLSFGANFGAGDSGTSDAINAQTTNGSINLRQIKMADEANVGDKVNLFTNSGMDIDNIDNFSVVLGNYVYTFSHDGNILSISTKTLGSNLPYYVASGKTLDIENTDFDNKSTKGIAVNDDKLLVSESHFSNNSNQGNDYNSDGDGGVILNRSGGSLEVVNSDFTGNKANGLGGAIYSAEDFSITADAQDSLFSGNEDKNGKNDIYMEDGKTLNLNTVNGGEITFESGLTGNGSYDINIVGDADGVVNLNAKAEKAENVSVAGSTLKLSDEANLDNINLNINGGMFDIANNSLGTMSLNGLVSNSGLIALDVDPDTNSADVLNVSGNFSGTVNLVLNVLSEAKPTENILFAQTPGLTSVDEGSFDIYRVIGSPYEWATMFDDTSKDWYLFLSADSPRVAPEIIAYAGLQTAALEQTRSMVGNVRNKAAANKTMCQRCGLYDEKYSGKPLDNVWVNPIYHEADIKNPVNMHVDIHGLEAGFDRQIDSYNKAGVFASYRQGDYDLNGQGQKFFAKTGSQIDIDSYTGGLYYRFDKHNNWIFATAYAGVQKADLRTNDGIKVKTDGTQLGASVEAGHAFVYSKGFTIEPSVGVAYTQVDFDDINDDFGKTASYKTIRQTELEAGIKFEKSWNYVDGDTKIYFKPSVIEPLTSGDKATITGLDNRVNTYYDKTMGRVEGGFKISLTDELSGYGFANHTFGNKYKASSVGLGLNVAW